MAFSSTTNEQDLSSLPCPNYPGIFALRFCVFLCFLHQSLAQSSNCNVFGVFLSSLSSLVKSGDTGNGVTFRSGDNVDLGPSHIGVSFIDTAMQMVSPLLAVNIFCAISMFASQTKCSTRYLLTTFIVSFLLELLVSAAA